MSEQTECERLMDEIIAKYGSFDNAIRAGMRQWWDTPEGKVAMALIYREFIDPQPGWDANGSPV